MFVSDLAPPLRGIHRIRKIAHLTRQSDASLFMTDTNVSQSVKHFHKSFDVDFSPDLAVG